MASYILEKNFYYTPYLLWLFKRQFRISCSRFRASAACMTLAQVYSSFSFQFVEFQVIRTSDTCMFDIVFLIAFELGILQLRRNVLLGRIY